jgi:ABC-type antimicrobial peptide transport system permease subunit
MFLIEAPPPRAAAVAARLTRALQDVGLELVPTAERLRELHAVQTTYLLIFQVLGGLGLLLGSIGLGAVVLRNALERRSELALCAAVGYAPRALRRLLWTEHGLLLALGVACGAGAAALAVFPGWTRPGAPLAVWPLVGLIAAVTASGALWVWLASAAATRGPLLAALRAE